MPSYECDKCGACCNGTLIVEADLLDVLREPRLIEADPHWHGKPVLQVIRELEDDYKAVLIACGRSRPCPFLNAQNHCDVYPTRPNTCVAFQAGDEQCQEARAANGLPPLQPMPDSVSQL